MAIDPSTSTIRTRFSPPKSFSWVNEQPGSFMPAQDIHILVNHKYPQLSPWYELDVDSPETLTAKYIFKPTAIKRFHAL